MPKAVLDHFSQRHAEITELAVGAGLDHRARHRRDPARDPRPQAAAGPRRRAGAVASASRRARVRHSATIEKALGRQASGGRTRGIATQLAEHLAGPNGLTLQESTFTAPSCPPRDRRGAPEASPPKTSRKRPTHSWRSTACRSRRATGTSPRATRRSTCSRPRLDCSTWRRRKPRRGRHRCAPSRD